MHRAIAMLIAVLALLVAPRATHASGITALPDRIREPTHVAERSTKPDLQLDAAEASGHSLFLQRDPSGFEDSVNLYAFAGNSPINRRDPTGMAGVPTEPAEPGAYEGDPVELPQGTPEAEVAAEVRARLQGPRLPSYRESLETRLNEAGQRLPPEAQRSLNPATIRAPGRKEPLQQLERRTIEAELEAIENAPPPPRVEGRPPVQLPPQRPVRPLDWSLVSKSGETRQEHIVSQHGDLNLQKPAQGVFYGSPIEVTNEAWKIAQETNVAPITVKGADVYVVPRPNAGYFGGFSGQRQNLNTVTLIVQPGTAKVITAYPGNGFPLPTSATTILGQ